MEDEFDRWFDEWWRGNSSPFLTIKEIAKAGFHAGQWSTLVEIAELRAALKRMCEVACRPGDDGKYEDAFDDARRLLGRTQ